MSKDLQPPSPSEPLSGPASNVALFPGVTSIEQRDEVDEVLKKSRATIRSDPIIIGYDAEGTLVLIIAHSVGVERGYFMLSQALALIMERTAYEDEDEDGA